MGKAHIRGVSEQGKEFIFRVADLTDTTRKKGWTHRRAPASEYTWLGK